MSILFRLLQVSPLSKWNERFKEQISMVLPLYRIHKHKCKPQINTFILENTYNSVHNSSVSGIFVIIHVTFDLTAQNVKLTNQSKAGITL